VSIGVGIGEEGTEIRKKDPLLTPHRFALFGVVLSRTGRGEEGGADWFLKVGEVSRAGKAE